MGKYMKSITVISAVLTVITVIIYLVSKIDIFETLYITFATIFYHFVIRLLIGQYYHKKYNNKINYKRKMFNVGNTEYKIYEIIKVKNWKKYLPTYNNSFFDSKVHTHEEIVMATCQSELVHKTIVVFSFLPIISAIWLGAIEIFIITSVISAFIDLLFVIIQRYNRLRLLKLINEIENKKK